MRVRSQTTAALVGLFLLGRVVLGDAATATDPHAGHKQMMQTEPPQGGQTAAIELIDKPLLNRYGAPVRFKSDIVQDHLVAINVMYTTCTTVCPVTSALFAKLQNGLVEQGDKDVRLVSVSVDPVTDTPERLRAYAEKMHAGPNWAWLTGTKPAVDEVLEGLGAYTADFREHPPVIVIGDPVADRWRRFYGFPSPDEMLRVLNGLAAERGRADLGGSP